MSEIIAEDPPPAPRRRRPSFPVVEWGPRLRWFAAEFLVVVTGILCAFAINSWADTRADRRVETSYLAALEADFIASRSDLEAVIAVAEESMAQARRLLRYTAMGPERAPLDSALVASGRFRGFDTFAPTTGAYDNLILSGEVSLIRSDSLREALAAWGGMLARNRVLEGVMIEQYHGHTPFMRERLAFRELPSDETVRGLPPTRHRTNVGALLDDMAFENLVRERLAAADEALAYNRRLRSHIDLILRLIREARPRI